MPRGAELRRHADSVAPAMGRASCGGGRQRRCGGGCLSAWRQDQGRRWLAAAHLAAVVWVAAPGLSAAAEVTRTPHALTPLVAAGDRPAPPWRVQGLPKQKMALTQFSLVDLDGQRALRVESNDAYGNLVHPLKRASQAMRLSWQWRLQQGIPEADLRRKAGDDVALKVCVFFDQPRERLDLGERLLMQVAQARSGQALPLATLCYVWDTRLRVGEAIDNAYTRRVRYLVLQSGPGAPDGWVQERRDVAADFLRVFGDESPDVPPVTGIAIGADTDNTHGHSIGFVAGLTLEP
jgi:hypothetical protein